MNDDIVSEVLRSVRLRGAVYFNVTGIGDWVAEAPPCREIAAAVMPGCEHVMEYHVVVAGECWGATVGAEPVRLVAGDIILFPHGDPHVISSTPGLRAPAEPAGYFERRDKPRPFTLSLNAREAPSGRPVDEAGGTRLLCGFLGCDLRPFNPLIGALPRLMHLRTRTDDDWALQCMRQAAAESTRRGPGGQAMLERLSEMLFIDAVRRFVAGLPETSNGWLAALGDRYVGRALGLIHAAPAHSWTVDELSGRVGLSRSAFHERFAEVVGGPPMEYLANWRMQVGARLLRDTSATVASIAQDAGYESEAAFARAFKRRMGTPPAAWRRQVRAKT